MTILLFKLFTTPTLILVATLVGRRFGQAVGGWLVGLPLTSGPIAVFLALEHGPRFAQAAAAGSIEGTVAQAFFAAAYARLARRHRWPVCLAVATIAFLASGLLLVWAQPPLWLLVAAGIASLAAALRVVGKPARPAAPIASPPWDLPVRMTVATLLVLAVTAVAAAIGPSLSGLAATFPLFAIVLAVFAHRQDAAAAQSVMRGLLLGLFGFVGFFLTVSLLVTITPLATTFALALAVNLAIHAATFVVLRGDRAAHGAA